MLDVTREDNPYSAGTAKTGDLTGIYCRDIHYNKTNYEIAYRIIEESELLIENSTKIKKKRCKMFNLQRFSHLILVGHQGLEPRTCRL